jgi:hypothetical protein
MSGISFIPIVETPKKCTPGGRLSRGRFELRKIGSRAPRSIELQGLKHDPEKCAAVFRKDHAQSKELNVR